MTNEIERYRLSLEVDTFGKPDQVKASAIRVCRELAVKGVKVKEARFGIGVQADEPLEWDDFSDDQGEMWHQLDWTKEIVGDEGRGVGMG